MIDQSNISNTLREKSSRPFNTMETIKYRFICQSKVQFGQAIYIVGNIEHLGQWDISCAIRLQNYLSDFWVSDINVPVDTQIEYKYFVSSYDHHLRIKNLEIEAKNWIGDQQGQNLKLFLGKRQECKILETKKTKNLKIMSFNIRYENSGDKDEFNWLNRRQNVIEVIKEHYPSIIGVQEAVQAQRIFMQNNLSHLYNYEGKARDCKRGEQVGIFYDKQRFIVIEKGFRWISPTQQPGSIGYGAKLPRYFTFLILEDTYVSQKFNNYQKVSGQQEVSTWIPQNLLMVVNVHLDHMSKQAQKKGVQFISRQVQTKFQEHKDRLKDIFIFGDFNTFQKDPIFKKFHETKPHIQSIRDYFEHKSQRDFCDQGYTFNGFVERDPEVKNPLWTIDHLFIHTCHYKPSQFKVIREMIHQPKNSKYRIISDHYPILGIFKPVIKEEFF